MLIGLEFPAAIIIIIAGLLTLTGCAGSPAPSSDESSSTQLNDDVAFLARYGEWIDVPAYGQVWRPDVAAEWRPFYYGHWVWDDNDDSWAWVSYEPFGWLVYHYGNWDYEAGYGWIWIPGDDWSPARVEWMTYGEFAGWAPLPPPAVIWPDPWMGSQISVWNLVEVNDFTQENVGQYRIVKPVRTGDVSPTVIRRPPEVKDVESRTKSTVTVIKTGRETVKIKGTPRQQLVLPSEQNAKVKKHEKEVMAKVLPGPKATAKTKAAVKEKKTGDKNAKKDANVDKGTGADKDKKKDNNQPAEKQGKDDNKKPDQTDTRSKDRDKK